MKSYDFILDVLCVKANFKKALKFLSSQDLYT